MTLTIDNWKSEYKRLEMKYKRLPDSQSLEAKGIMDHMEAVKKIIQEIEIRESESIVSR